MNSTNLRERHDYWRPHIEAWQQSDLSAAAYCKQQALNCDQFYYWRKNLLTLTTDSKPAGFTRVSQLAVGANPEREGLAAHLPNGMCLSGITAGNLDVAVAILRQL